MNSQRAKLQSLLANAYAPYSGVRVAALLITSTGQYQGVNVENAVNPSSLCAERSAIFSAISQAGAGQRFLEIHILSSLDHAVFPCGGCLQVMSEFFDQKTQIWVYNSKTQKMFMLKDLLPKAPTELKEENAQWK